MDALDIVEARHEILDEVRQEREYQVGKWGLEADFETNTPNDFVAYIAAHSSRWFTGGFAPYERDELQAFYRQMIKVAALGVAAAESASAILNGEVDRPDVLKA